MAPLHRRQFLALSAAFLLLPKALKAEGETPEAVIERLHSALTQAMSGEVAADFQARYDLLAPSLSATFDYDFMAEVAAGRFYKDFSAEEQTRYRQLFTEISIATAASRFGPAKNVGFSIVGRREASDGSIVVDTELKVGSKAPRAIGYLMRPTADGTSWRAVDLFYESTISELATKRSEYVSVLKQGGLAELEQRLQEKLASYRAGQAE